MGKRRLPAAADAGGRPLTPVVVPPLPEVLILDNSVSNSTATLRLRMSEKEEEVEETVLQWGV